ncbi:MAG: hypothetical protein ACOZAJ_02065 [Patescibacteria group bacterium]
MKITWPKNNEIRIEGLKFKELSGCGISLVKKADSLEIIVSNCKTKPVKIKVSYDDESEQFYVIGQINGQPVVSN